MKKLISLSLAILLVTMIVATGVVAQENPNASAKATAMIKELCVFSCTHVDNPPFDIDGHCSAAVPILEQTIKTAQDKDLFIDASLQSGVFTGTTVKSKNMVKDTSVAAAAVLLWVVIDEGEANEQVAYPGYPIFYNARIQKLSATLQGEIESVNPDTGAITLGDPEVISLFIGTLSANSFNFIVQDLDSGMHKVTVYAACCTGGLSQQGSATAVAVIGLGSVTVQEVRMVRGEDAVTV